RLGGAPREEEWKSGDWRMGEAALANISTASPHAFFIWEGEAPALPRCLRSLVVRIVQPDAQLDLAFVSSGVLSGGRFFGEAARVDQRCFRNRRIGGHQDCPAAGGDHGDL